MSAIVTGANANWLSTGQEIFPAMLKAIDEAQQSVCLETYIYSPGLLADRFRDALIRARQRGVQVRVLIDALGSYSLPSDFFQPLVAAGGEVRRFNPLSLNRLGIRNHRKLLVCDGHVAFVGGFNIASEYEGDGITSGWRDLGLRIEGNLVGKLAASFDEMFGRADFQHKRFERLRRTITTKVVTAQNAQLLLSGPGRGLSPIKRSLHRDLRAARSAQIMVAYFLPSWRLRRQLSRIVRQGGRAQLILAGKSDVSVSRLAAESLYPRLLKAGIEIYEYQPQILHAKLFVIDDLVYVGSANLDPRSLYINYELMIRFRSSDMAQQAREVFQSTLDHCQAVSLENWRKSYSVWRRLKRHWAYLLLVRLDPYIANRQWRALKLHR
jgi:cardiolipin synthase